MESIAQLIKQLPDGYEEECIKQGALTRKRGVSNPADLMLLVLFHLHNGCSLLEISEIAKLSKMGKMSDVAFMKRFEKCNNWFVAINKKIVHEGVIQYDKPEWLEGKTVLAVDASDVKEKGRSGRIYRLHYALDLFQMISNQYKITTNKTGESLCHYNFQKGDLVIADRGYARIKDITHCMDVGAEYLIRLRANSFTLRDEHGKVINLRPLLGCLKDDECLDIQAYATNVKGARTPVRICAKRKPPESIDDTHKKLHRKETKNQCEISEETKQFHEYIVLITNLEEAIPTESIIDAYHLRWQVEMLFKRLKSILDFGELPKRSEKSSMAWLNGKIMIALLFEKMIAAAAFPPQEDYEQEYMA